MAIIAAMDAGAESSTVGVACAVAVVGDNDEAIRSKAYHLLDVTARKRIEHVHAPVLNHLISALSCGPSTQNAGEPPPCRHL